MSEKAEELAGTDPNDTTSRLIITNFVAGAAGLPAEVTWQSVPTRFYYLQERLDLSPAGSWFDCGPDRISPDGASAVRTLGDPSVPARLARLLVARAWGDTGTPGWTSGTDSASRALPSLSGTVVWAYGVSGYLILSACKAVAVC